jgi:hypothetical protein
MDYDISEVRHLEHYISMNNVDLSAIEAVGEKIEDVKYPFKKVSLEGLIPKNFRIHNRNACSACMNAFLLSCHLLGGTLKDNMDVYMGSIVETEDIRETLSLAFGNCCPGDIIFDKRIRGCPPYPFELKECLRENLEQT